MRPQDRENLVMLALFWAMVGVFVYFALHYLLPWLLPFFLGAGVAALARPAVLKLHRRTGIGEKACAGVVLAVFYLAAGCAVALFFTIILAQIYELFARLPALYAQNIAPLLERLNNWFYGLAQRFFPETGEGINQFYEAVTSAAQQAAVDGSSHLMGWAAGLVVRLPMLLLTAIFTIVISVLVSTSYPKVVQFLCGLAPRRFASRIAGLQRFLRETVWQYARAYTIIMAVTFLQLAVGLWLLRFDYVLPVAAAITLVDLLPLIGSGTVLVPWGIVLLAGGDTAGGVGLLLLFAVILVVRNIIEPRIVGSQIGLNPIATITSMYAGLQIAGFVGMLAAPFGVLLVLHLKEDWEISGVP